MRLSEWGCCYRGGVGWTCPAWAKAEQGLPATLGLGPPRLPGLSFLRAKSPVGGSTTTPSTREDSATDITFETEAPLPPDTPSAGVPDLGLASL